MKFIQIYLLSIILFACDGGNQESIRKDLLQLDAVNYEFWDINSKQIIKSFLKIPIDKLTYLQKKMLVEVLIVHKNTKEAISIIKEMKFSKSQYLSYLFAFAYYQQGQLLNVLQIIDLNKQTKPHMSILYLKYKVLFELGRYNEIIQLSELDYNENFVKDSLLKYYLAVAFLQNKQCNKSIPLFKHIIKNNPHANKIFGPLSMALQLCNKPKEAIIARKKQGSNSLTVIDEFNSRLNKNGDPVSYYNQLLNIALEEKNMNSIIINSQQLISYNAVNPKLFNNYAISLYATKKFELVNDVLFKAIKLDNKNIKSYQLLYEYNRNSNIDIAEKALNQLLKYDANNKIYLRAKIYINEKRKNK